MANQLGRAMSGEPLRAAGPAGAAQAARSHVGSARRADTLLTSRVTRSSAPPPTDISADTMPCCSSSTPSLFLLGPAGGSGGLKGRVACRNLNTLTALRQHSFVAEYHFTGMPATSVGCLIKVLSAGWSSRRQPPLALGAFKAPTAGPPHGCCTCLTAGSVASVLLCSVLLRQELRQGLGLSLTKVAGAQLGLGPQLQQRIGHRGHGESCFWEDRKESSSAGGGGSCRSQGNGRQCRAAEAIGLLGEGPVEKGEGGGWSCAA